MSRRQGVSTVAAVTEMEIMQEGRDRLAALPVWVEARILDYWVACHGERVQEWKAAQPKPAPPANLPPTPPGTP